SGRGEAAARVAQAWAERRPDNVEALHLRDAVLARPVERQPAALVAQRFDEMAEEFDQHLLVRLGYAAPERLKALIAGRMAPALKPGGWCAFSTEAGETGEYVLHGNGRYAHTADYIARLAAGRFEIVAETTAMLRREGGRALDGGYFLLRAAGA